MVTVFLNHWTHWAIGFVLQLRVWIYDIHVQIATSPRHAQSWLKVSFLLPEGGRFKSHSQFFKAPGILWSKIPPTVSSSGIWGWLSAGSIHHSRAQVGTHTPTRSFLCMFNTCWLAPALCQACAKHWEYSVDKQEAIPALFDLIVSWVRVIINHTKKNSNYNLRENYESLTQRGKPEMEFLRN